MNNWLEANRCTGCAACANACPKDAIRMEPDERGFIHPVIDASLCVDCGRCEKTCPVLHPAPLTGNSATPTFYAGWSLDVYNRYHSTSGGVFTELCKGVLSRGGAIAGAVYEPDNSVRHIVIDDEAGLERVRQSKYVQSDSGSVYRQEKGRLAKGQQVLLCGGPCQAEGLLTYLGGRPKGLWTVDFICRGSNSPKAYRKWLDMLEQKHGAKATRVWFKNKECGWNRFSTRVDFANGRTYRRDRYHDLFMKGYLEKNLYIRPSCASCPFKGLPRVADITLADFWRVDKKLDADMGTSMLIINNDNGRALVEEARARLFLTERTMEEAVGGNRMLDTNAWVSKYSGEFLQSLDHRRFDRAYWLMMLKLKKLKHLAKRNEKRRQGAAGQAKK